MENFEEDIYDFGESFTIHAGLQIRIISRGPILRSKSQKSTLKLAILGPKAPLFNHFRNI